MFQDFESPTGMSWIWIRCANNRALDTGGDEGIRAGRRATMRAARLECDVKCRAFGIVAVFLCVAKRLDFRVRQTSAPMPAAPDDFPAPHKQRADHRIWRSFAIAAPGEPEG